MQTVLLIWVLVMNVLAFALMGADKSKAGGGKRRIPEKTLFLSAVLGGSIGAIGGMNFFRHKTKHLSFQIGLPLILILQIALIVAASYWLMFVH